VLSVTLFALHVPSALANSGSIANIHATGSGEEVEATYTTNVDTCGEFSCAWFPYAEQFPASQSCSPGSSHLTYVGDFHENLGSETASDTFYPAFSGTIKLCLYASVDEDELVAEALYTPPPPPPPPPPPLAIVSGAITNVHAVSDSSMAATYTTNFNVCESSGYCGWFPHAYQYPASQPCSPNGSELTYVGDLHSTAGTEVATDDFSPKYGAGKICLYGYHAGKDYFVAEATYFQGPAPTIRRTATVGDQTVWIYFPRSCVAAGRTVELRVVSKTKRSLFGKRPSMRIVRVAFKLDRARRTDSRAPWKATFATAGLAAHSSHTAGAKLQFKQRGGQKKLTRKFSARFRIC
jgi:hypothetical protein